MEAQAGDHAEAGVVVGGSGTAHAMHSEPTEGEIEAQSRRLRHQALPTRVQSEPVAELTGSVQVNTIVQSDHA